jgi:hypothetical protein
MKDKYYTPSIEEFHVGFEYEAIKLKKFEIKNIPVGTSLQTYIDMNDLVDGWIKLTWSETCSPENSFNVLRDSNGVTNISVPESVRVKYLDKEDIESLGFTTNKLKYWEIQGDSIIYKLKNYTLVFWHSAYKSNYKTNVYIRQETGLGQHCFKGEIKNKSELKRLLKQLGV